MAISTWQPFFVPTDFVQFFVDSVDNIGVLSEKHDDAWCQAGQRLLAAKQKLKRLVYHDIDRLGGASRRSQNVSDDVMRLGFISRLRNPDLLFDYRAYLHVQSMLGTSSLQNKKILKSECKSCKSCTNYNFIKDKQFTYNLYTTLNTLAKYLKTYLFGVAYERTGHTLLIVSN